MHPEEKNVKEWPPHKYALNELKKSEEIGYGKTISWERIESLLDRGPRDEWPFKGEFIELCQLLKEDGFLVTQSGMDGEGVRILNREEMSANVRNKEMGKANDSLRNSLMLSKVPRDNLDLKTVKGLDHWETKTAVVGATVKVLLRKRNLPTPEAAVRSVRLLATTQPEDKS